MAELINKTDSLNAGREKINNSISAADNALSKANAAEVAAAAAGTKADAAKAKAEQVQTELNTIVNNDTSGLGGQLSVGSDGITVHANAQERFSNEHNALKEKTDKSRGQKFALQITAIEDTTINTLTQRRSWHPMLLAVKESNIPNKPSDGSDQSPRPVGWLYYNPDVSSPSGYKLLYASGKPDNIVQSFNWNSAIAFENKSPEYFSFYITRQGDIIVLYRGEKETRSEHGRKNPIVYPYNDLANPVAVDLSSKAVKPTSWLMSCGADYMYTLTKNYFMFGEYTRPIHNVANIWKVVPPFTSPANWTIVKSDPTSGSNTTGFEHFHMVSYDPISGAIYASNGDDEASTKMWESRDNGLTWNVVMTGIQNGRLCNLVFKKDHIYWASDEPTAHVLNRVARILNVGDGMRYGDFANVQKLADLPPQQASYGTIMLHNPPGLLMMDRFDNYIAGRKLEVPFWSFETNKLHIVKNISVHSQAVFDGLTSGGWGLRPNAYQKYQGVNDKRVIMGFDNLDQNYSNLLDVLDNNPGFYQSYTYKLHNLALEVVYSNEDGGDT